MTGMPNLGERVQQIRVGKAATTAADNDKQLERSQVGAQQLQSDGNIPCGELCTQEDCGPCLRTMVQVLKV